MPTQILVTGVSGFVGSAIARRFREVGGCKVIGLSRSAARNGCVDEHFGCDLTQPLPATFPRVEVMVHCAALSSPWASPAAYQASNVLATQSLLAEAKRQGVRQFVFISSSSVQYAHGDQLGLTETSPLPAKPINLYAATKRQGEELVSASGLPALILRPRAVFGPGDTVLLPRILRAARKGMLPIISRPDGVSPLADLIYIGNLAHYVERAVATQASGLYNLTNNQPVALYPFLERIFAALGVPPVRRRVPVGLAMALAKGLETISASLLGYREPPITQFGVEVMAYSKTFDVSRMIDRWGPPPVSLDEGVERFLRSQTNP